MNRKRKGPETNRADMNRNHWTRARAADRLPTKSKRVQYDAQNATAASIILSSPERHTAFQLDWARRFRQRYNSQNNPTDLQKKNS